jgi:5-(carboxyamino)imidazole ribonucleotide synthase
MTKPVLGAIGGGQLARMMAAPALHMGIELKVLAETAGSSAAIAASQIGNYNQLEVVQKFAESVDVVTFDHEHVPLEILRRLEADGVSVQPPSSALAFAQNKLHMRKRLAELGMPMPAWSEIKNQDELDSFISAQGGVAILKTPIGGYDGKGVRVVRSSADASDWFANLEDFGGSLLAEEKVDFVRELSQLSARNTLGEFAAWPLVETQQQNGVCAIVIAPAPNAPAGMLEQTVGIARTIASELGITGVLAVELFEARDGRILINELAMRPHNSGHFTIEGSTTSQFEQHIRAVLGLPLGATGLTANHAVMVNLLGTDDSNTFIEHFGTAMKSHPAAKLHTYGKSARAGRKMGHVTVVADDLNFALSEANAAAAVLLQGI